MPVKIGTYQFTPAQDDAAANVEGISRIAEQARAEGVQILAFPAFSLQGFVKPDRLHAVAQAIPGGAAVERLDALGRRLGMGLLVPMTEAGEDGRFYTACGVFGPEGLLGKYRKVHSCEPGCHSGGELPVFEMFGLRFGIAICNDANFPELYRAYSLLGAHAAFTLIGSGGHGGNYRRLEDVPERERLKTEEAAFDHFRLLVLQHARENRLYGIYVALLGPMDMGDRLQVFVGTSAAFFGNETLARLFPGEGRLMTVEVDPGHQEQVARTRGFLRQRRPEVYGRLLAEPVKID